MPTRGPGSHGSKLEQHLARVREAAAGAVQKGRKSKGHNAVEKHSGRVMELVGRINPSARPPGREAQGLAPWTHVELHVLRTHCGFNSSGERRESWFGLIWVRGVGREAHTGRVADA